VYPCAGDDRWISLAVETASEWRALVAAMGDPAWARAPELATLAGRIERRAALNQQLAGWTAGFDDHALAARLQAAGVAAAPVLTVGDLLADPHYRARDTFIEVEHPLGYRETIYGAYVKLSRTPAVVRPGPWIGQDNEHVFKQILGLDEARYEELVAAQVIF